MKELNANNQVWRTEMSEIKGDARSPILGIGGHP